MFGAFKARRQDSDTLARLYASVVDQVREPAFYTAAGVADTFEGRLELLMLHVALVLRRLNGAGRGEREQARLFSEIFFADLDGNLREIGIGDLTVPRKMRGFARSFYGRLAAYGAALDGPGDAALEAALARNVYDGANPAAGALAGYVQAAAERLAATERGDLLAGGFAFPPADALLESKVVA